jgi:hypothetical protein
MPPEQRDIRVENENMVTKFRRTSKETDNSAMFLTACPWKRLQALRIWLQRRGYVCKSIGRRNMPQGNACMPSETAASGIDAGAGCPFQRICAVVR